MRLVVVEVGPSAVKLGAQVVPRAVQEKAGPALAHGRAGGAVGFPALQVPPAFRLVAALQLRAASRAARTASQASRYSALGVPALPTQVASAKGRPGSCAQRSISTPSPGCRAAFCPGPGS